MTHRLTKERRVGAGTRQRARNIKALRKGEGVKGKRATRQPANLVAADPVTGPIVGSFNTTFTQQCLNPPACTTRQRARQRNRQRHAARQQHGIHQSSHRSNDRFWHLQRDLHGLQRRSTVRPERHYHADRLRPDNRATQLRRNVSLRRRHGPVRTGWRCSGLHRQRVRLRAASGNGSILNQRHGHGCPRTGHNYFADDRTGGRRHGCSSSAHN